MHERACLLPFKTTLTSYTTNKVNPTTVISKKRDKNIKGTSVVACNLAVSSKRLNIHMMFWTKD